MSDSRSTHARRYLSNGLNLISESGNSPGNEVLSSQRPERSGFSYFHN